MPKRMVIGRKLGLALQKQQELGFYLRYYLPARSLARRTYEALDQQAFDELKNRTVGSGNRPHWDKYVLDIRAHLMVAAYHALELGLHKGPKLSILDISTGAGFFPRICQDLGHTVMATDVGDTILFNEMTAFLGVDRRVWKIAPFEPAPDLGRRFDLATAWAMDFDKSGCPQGERWTKPQWKSFLEDLARNRMNPGGKMVFAIKRIPGGKGQYAYDAELFDYFASAGALLRKRRVVFESLAGLLK